MTEQDDQRAKDSLFIKLSPVDPSRDAGLPLDGLEATAMENECLGVDDHDTAEGTRSTVQDELKRYAMLRGTMQHLEDRLRTDYDQVICLDRQWRYTRINEKVIEVTGLAKAQLLGHSIWEVFPDLVGTQFYQQVHQALATQSITHFEYYYPARHQWFDNWVYPSPTDLTLLVSDISHFKQAQESLQLHTHILESIAEGVVISDESGVIVFSNAMFERMFGYAQGELLGLPLTVLNDLPPADNQRLVDHIMTSLHRDGRWSGELRNRRKDGTPFITEAHASALRIENQTYLIGIQQDITERKRTEQRLTTQCAIACVLAEATTLDEAIPTILRSLCQELDWQLAILWLVDLQTQQLYCRDWHSSTLPAEDFVSISQATTFSAGVGLPGQVWRSHQPTWFLEMGQNPNFSRAAWAHQIGLRSAFGFPILSGGDCLGVIECYSDRRQPPDPHLLHCMNGIGGQIGQFMERLRVEQECQHLLQQERIARAAAEASNRIKDEFLSVLSHELRTPLNPILGWAALLKKGSLSAQETTVALETIACSAKHQLQLVTDLLDVSQILRGEFNLEVCPVDLSGSIAIVLETAQVAAQAKSIQIQTRFASEVGVVLGDPARLQQIIWNLLSNAIKFTANGGRVEIQLEQVADQVQMTVSDTGKGIAPDLLPYLFQRFYQEDSTITRKFGGLGIGLSLVRYLVELHGGTVSVASPGPGLGTTFTVKLPSMSILS
jgi:PAS domain S-box-containing protein